MNFKFEEVIALAKAGFTAEQIEKIANSVMANQEVPEQTKIEETPPAKKEALPTPPAPVVDSKNLDAILDKIDKLTTAIHANAIINSTQPAKETPDDILAGMINPKKGDK